MAFRPRLTAFCPTARFRPPLRPPHALSNGEETFREPFGPMPFSAPIHARKNHARQTATPDIRQGEHAECGLAALAILMGHHGVHVPLAALRERAGTTLFGTTLRQLRDLAREEGFEATARRVEPERLAACGLPLIAHMNFIHFVVVERVSCEGVHINDPADGPKIMPNEEFSRVFTGVVLALKPVAAVPRGAAFSFHAALRQALRGQETWIAAALLLSCASGAAAALGFWRFLTDEAGMPAAILLGATPCAMAASLFLMEKAGLGAREQASSRLFAALESADDSHYLFARPQQTLSLFAALERLQSPATPAGGLAFCWLLAATLAGLALAPAAVGPVAALWLAQAALLMWAATRRGSLPQRFGHGRMPVESVTADFLADSRAFRMGRNGDALFTRLAGLHAAALSQALKTAQARYGLKTALFALDLAKLAAPLLAPGGADALLALALAAASCPLLRRMEQGMHAKPLKEALLRLADLPAARKSTPPQPAMPAASGLCLRDAGWWPPHAGPVLENLSLRLPPGRVLAVHGPPGCGLTSFARLASGLLLPSHGSVTLDGRPLAALPPGAAILVDHHRLLVSGTVRDNLRLGDDAIGKEEMRAALALVELDETLAPRGGLECGLREDRPALSGGQLRRLSIARALCRAPRLLVLDEALDAVEPDLAHRILSRLRQRGAITIFTTKNRDLLAAADLTLFPGGAP